MFVDEALSDPTIRNLCKEFLKMCQQHDPIDAFQDLQLATDIWRSEILKVENYQDLKKTLT